MAEEPEHAAAGGGDAGAPARRACKANSLANRIKRLMQTDEDVGKIAQAAPAVLGKALELFPGCLCSGANTVAQQYTNSIAAGHLKAAVAAYPMLDNLKGTVARSTAPLSCNSHSFGKTQGM